MSKSLINVRQLGFVVLLIFAYFLRDFLDKREMSSPPPEQETSILEQLAAKKLVTTRHGACRMDCREISLDEIKDVMLTGQINSAKSDPNPSGGKCPAYAVEGTTDDGQEVRIILALCADETRIVTAIDLENDYDCYCP